MSEQADFADDKRIRHLAWKHEAWMALTPREDLVIRLMLSGLKKKDIASEFGVSSVRVGSIASKGLWKLVRLLLD